MKAGILNLEQAIKSFSGDPIPEQPNSENKAVLTYKTVILNMLGSMKPDDGKEAIQVSVLGTHIWKQGEAFEVDQADLILLKKAVEQNAPGYIALVIGQVFGYLETIGVD
jgi:hypothetical protein